MGEAEPNDRPRYWYWAYFEGGDPHRRVRVDYRIPGRESGTYFRNAGDRPSVLLRYDWRADPGTFPRGARLDSDGRWHATESPDRNVWLGSDYGDPVTDDEAAELVVALGHATEVLADTTVVRPDPPSLSQAAGSPGRVPEDPDR
jgi:hypothetical protein